MNREFNIDIIKFTLTMAKAKMVWAYTSVLYSFSIAKYIMKLFIQFFNTYSLFLTKLH